MIFRRQVRRQKPDGREVDRSVGEKLERDREPAGRPGSRNAVIGLLLGEPERFPAVLEERLVTFACVQVAGFDLAHVGDDLGHRLALASGEVLDAGDEIGVGESCDTRKGFGLHSVVIPRRFSGLRNGRRRTRRR